MKWVGRDLKLKSKHRTTEVSYEFLFFPHLCEDSHYRWLEKVKVERYYWVPNYEHKLHCQTKYFPIDDRESI